MHWHVNHNNEEKTAFIDVISYHITCCISYSQDEFEFYFAISRICIKF